MLVLFWDVNITESEFSGNGVKAASGGVIFLRDSKYESQNCTFKDNEPDDVYPAVQMLALIWLDL